MHAFITIILLLITVFLMSPIMQSHTDWLNKYREDCTKKGGTVIKPRGSDHICVKELTRNNQ